VVLTVAAAVVMAAVIMAAVAGAFRSVATLRVALVAVLSLVGVLLLPPIVVAVLTLVLRWSLLTVSFAAFGLLCWV
jgi:hypothetical protein